jgi:HEAT repeat protein
VSVVERLCAPDPAERVAAIAEISQQETADAVPLQALAECLGDPRKVVQRGAAEAFAALGARGVAVDDVLMAALHSAAPRQRWGAAFALSLLGVPPPAALPVLLECLGIDDGDVRWAACGIVVRMHGHMELIGPLCALLCTGNAAQRKMAVYCLRDLDARSPAVEQALCVALDDADAGVRLAALSTVARLATDRAAVAARLITLLDDADAGVRRAAAAALGTLGERSPTVLAALRVAVGSPDPSLERAAAGALRLLQA